MKPRRWTERQILEIASSGIFYVNKYSYSAEKVRKLTRRMCKDGKLTMVMFDGKYFHYRKSKGYECHTRPQG
jgi:hypothetical protein